MINKDTTFLGYRRENGRVGVRNHVIVLPVDDISNAAAEAVANNIKGTMAIPHPYGRLQFGADLELHFRTLIGTGSNPNVAAVIVIGIEPQWTKLIVDGIAKTGKPVQGFWIEQNGDHETIMRASKAAKVLVQVASEKQREVCPISDLWVSTKCGESDTTSGCGANPTVGNAFDKLYELGATLVFGETSELTGGEHLVAERCATPEVKEKFMSFFNRYQDMINRHKTSDLSDSQPTKGNIEGGLTTIEEKALGNIQKIGKKCKVDGVLDKAEMPTSSGLWFMDSSSAAAEMVTLCAASGYVVHFFPTGQGNVIGNPILLAAARDQHGRRRRQAARLHATHRQRPPHLGRGAGPPRIRADPAVRKRVKPALVVPARAGTTCFCYACPPPPGRLASKNSLIAAVNCMRRCWVRSSRPTRRSIVTPGTRITFSALSFSHCTLASCGTIEMPKPWRTISTAASTELSSSSSLVVTPASPSTSLTSCPVQVWRSKRMNGALRSASSGASGSPKWGRRGTISTIGSLYSRVHSRLDGSARGGWVTIAASSSPRSTWRAKSPDSPANSWTLSLGCARLRLHSASANAPISAETSAPITTLPDSSSLSPALASSS
jgi:(2R)-sulfolactate sulfo-lyase subunit beta